MDFSKYIFRSHMVGKIINVPKSLTQKQKDVYKDYTDRKNGIGRPLTDIQLATWGKYYLIDNEKPSLTDGQKNILSELVFAEKYGRKKEINSDKLRKGIEKEKEARDLLSFETGLFLTACEERKENKYVTGAIDIKPNNVITDIKCSWNWESYSKILNDKPNEVYLRQLDSYMDLWGIKDSLLCHVLLDTPYSIVEKEIRKKDWELNILDVEGNIREERIDEVKKIISNHIFTRKGIEGFCEYSSNIEIEWFGDFKEIPSKERIHMIPHSFSKERIEQRNECIAIARKYMNKVNPINNFNTSLIS